MNRARFLAVAVVGVVAVLVIAAVVPSRNSARVPAVRRVLVVSMPTLAWRDVSHRTMPTLDAFSRTAGIADLATRVGLKRTTLTDAYVTMGAGTRARGGDAGSTALDANEPYGDSTATTVYARRTGWQPDGEVVELGIPGILAANARTTYRAHPGELGDALAKHGVARSVVANGDAGATSGSFVRPAATAVMSGKGTVPNGEVANDLLVADPTQPFGVRYNTAAVLRAFHAAWDGGGNRVAVVEASDLVRAAAYGAGTAGARAAMARQNAERAADGLLAALLRSVDPAHDAVLVVAPIAGAAENQLSLFALRAPGMAPNLLRSPSTRRSGFVQLGDVAPTILDLVRVPVPIDMEGRSVTVGASGGSAGARLSFVRDAASDAHVRDQANPYATITLWVIAGVVLFLFVIRRWLPSWLRAAPVAGAIVLLVFIPASYASVAVAKLTSVTLIGSIVAAMLVLGVVLERLLRRSAIDAVLAGLGLIVGVFVIDALLGSPLQLNTLYGYSAAVAGRFAGFGNLTFAFFAAATLLLAVVVTERVPGERGLQIAFSLFIVAVLVEGLPMLGGDAGGVLAMVPAFGVTAMLLDGRRVRVWHVLAWFAGGAAAVFVVGLVDLARPTAQQTHLARLFRRVQHGGTSYVTNTISRRWSANFGTSSVALLVLLLIVAVLVAEFFALQRGGRPRGIFAATPIRAALSGLVVLGLVGLVANDSGAAVPAMVFVMAVPVIVLRWDAWRASGVRPRFEVAAR
jgi:hypothetical protein